jgi:hypothetical protein
VEMEVEAKEAGFVSLTPKFLRWKSDNESDGWLINDFIKLYQREGDTSPAEESNQDIGSIYGVEINFEEEYPKIWLIRYTFDFSLWGRIPAISDHRTFYYPLGESSWFNVKEQNALRTGTPVDDSVKKRFWGIQKAIGKSIPLVQVTSRESIRTLIFDALLSLPE